MVDLTETIKNALSPIVEGIEKRLENFEESKKKSSKESNANQEKTDKKEPNEGVLQFVKEKTNNPLKGKEI